MGSKGPQTTFEFLEREVYLPGYMALVGQEYDLAAKEGRFDVAIKEPAVSRGHIVNYFTPRGLHICVSQAGVALVEHLIEGGELGELDIQTFREITLQGRLKIVELYQKWRREVKTSEPIQGVFSVSRLRVGKNPVLRLDFDFANRAVHGNLTSVIARNPVPQLNGDITRF